MGKDNLIPLKHLYWISVCAIAAITARNIACPHCVLLKQLDNRKRAMCCPLAVKQGLTNYCIGIFTSRLPMLLLLPILLLLALTLLPLLLSCLLRASKPLY